MIDGELLTDRLPGLGWVVALAGLLFIAVFSTLWLPRVPDEAGVLHSRGADRVVSTARVESENDSPPTVSMGRRQSASRGASAAESIYVEEPAGDDAATPLDVASEALDGGVTEESKTSASSVEPDGGRADSQSQADRIESGVSEHPVAQNGGSEQTSQNGTLAWE